MHIGKCRLPLKGNITFKQKHQYISNTTFITQNNIIIFSNVYRMSIYVIYVDSGIRQLKIRRTRCLR